jgi:hypothetical protein
VEHAGGSISRDRIGRDRIGHDAPGGAYFTPTSPP